MTQPTALFLADVLEDAGKPAEIAEKAAAELRRLHAQRDALLEALKLSRAQWIHSVNSDHCLAAIHTCTPP